MRNPEEIRKIKQTVFISLEKELAQHPPLVPPQGGVTTCILLVNKITALRLDPPTWSMDFNSFLSSESWAHCTWRCWKTCGGAGAGAGGWPSSPSYMRSSFTQLTTRSTPRKESWPIIFFTSQATFLYIYISILYIHLLSSRPTQKQFKLKQKDSNPQTDSPEWPFRCFKDKKVAENFFHLGGSRIYPS